MDIYKLYRNFWDYSFEHPQSIRPTHVAIYSFAVEHCNRLGWKQYFGFPTSMAMEATGVKSYSVFKKHFDDLVSFGFFEVAEYSKNQYSSNVIALKENCKANVKALDKALSKHASKQVQSISESTGESIVSIDIPYNQVTKEPKNKRASGYSPEFESAWNLYGSKGAKKDAYKVWQSLSQDERDKAVDAIPHYFATVTEIRFRKDFERYLKSGKFEENFTPQPNGQAPKVGKPNYHNLL